MRLSVFLVLLCVIGTGFCANPIITHIRTADPSVHIWADGKAWLYASHDQDDATDYSSMDGYHVFSSSDLVNWTDHGEVLHSRDVSWGKDGYMWAPDCAYKNGTYYFYYPHQTIGGAWVIGVATSDKPEGPFTDIGNYIQGTSGIDPCCFIDDDGQAYLYFGYYKVAKLKENMIELAESPRTVDYGNNGANTFQEGAYMHKRNGIYYYSWSRWQSPNNGGHYSTGSSPYGPFTYQGMLAGGPPGAQDHHSIVEYCGQTYYFYHVGNYTDSNGVQGKGYRRNACVDYLYYNPDGTIQMVQHTTEGIAPAACTPPCELTFDSVITTMELLPVTLEATVTDNPEPITSIVFEALDDDIDFPAGASYTLTDTTTNNLNPMATFTADTEGLYKFRLTVSDDRGNVVQELAQIEVYEDACEAQKNATSGWRANYYDRDEDCDVDLLDLAEFASEWLVDTRMTQQEIYAGEVVYLPPGSDDLWVEAENESLIVTCSDAPITDNNGIRIESKSNASGGLSLGYADNSDHYVTYVVDLAAGTYAITIVVANCPGNSRALLGAYEDDDSYGAVQLGLAYHNDFRPFTGTLTVPAGGIDSLTISWDNGGFGLDYFTIVR